MTPTSRLDLLLPLSILLIMSATSMAAPPGSTPIGLDEYLSTGKFPERIEILLDEADPREAIIPAWEGDRAHFRINPIKNVAGHYKLVVTLNRGIDPDSSRHELYGFYRYSVKNKDVFPLFQHFYLVSARPNSVVLTRVTESVPKKFYLANSSRTICENSILPTMFAERDPTKPKLLEYDVVELSMSGDETASMALTPDVAGRPRPQITRKKATAKLKAGGVLSARGRIYKVLQVTPKQKLGELGNLVGFIELASEQLGDESS